MSCRVPCFHPWLMAGLLSLVASHSTADTESSAVKPTHTHRARLKLHDRVRVHTRSRGPLLSGAFRRPPRCVLGVGTRRSFVGRTAVVSAASMSPAVVINVRAPIVVWMMVP